MNNTPRTDEAANDSIVKVYEVSKQLECELAEAREQRDRLADAIEEFISYDSDYINGCDCGKCMIIRNLKNALEEEGIMKGAQQ